MQVLTYSPKAKERGGFSAPRTSMAKHPNIVLMGIDSLLATHMSCYGYHRLTTPHIDRFAQSGTLFERTYSAHIPTTSAYASMLTGMDVFWYAGCRTTTQRFAQSRSQNSTRNPSIGRLRDNLCRLQRQPQFAWV